MRYDPGWAFPLEVAALGVVLALIWAGIELWLRYCDHRQDNIHWFIARPR